MKRIVFLIVLLLLTASLVSCRQPTPETPSVEPPAPTEEPTTPGTPTTAPPTTIGVQWEEIILPPMEKGFDQISGLVVKDNGNTISVYRSIGSASGGTATRYSHWQSGDGGNTWREIEEIVISGDPPGTLLPSKGESWEGDPHNPYLTEDQENIEQSLNPLKDFGKTWRVSQDNNNFFVAVQYALSDGSKFIGYPYEGVMVCRLFLSADEGKTWWQINFPSWFASYDAYPETLELTLLKGDVFLPIGTIAVASDGDAVKLFLTSYNSARTFWRTTLKSPN